jgi:hypothetical protein
VGAIAALAAVGLLVSLLTRNFGIVSLLIAYPAVIASGVLVLFCGIGLLTRLTEIDKAEAAVARIPGLTVNMTVGMDVMAATGSAAAAMLLFTLAILMIHRRLWARIVFAVLALLGVGLLGLLLTMARDEEQKRNPKKAGEHPKGFANLFDGSGISS